ncbi:DUF6597 domain-containing transcriptional factor [Streptomyces sp. NPDC059201]|uniref:DUF6597 domain-containing transcriptional factor n=2 Tax=Streptomyces TaxID=1883 RepID=UPI003684130B
MEYVGRVPAPPLDRFIDDIYCLSGVPGHRRMDVPPMPLAHLVISLGEPARLRDSDPSVPPEVVSDGWFLGLWTRRFLYEYPTRVRLVGVHFKPWGMSAFVDMPHGRAAGLLGARRRVTPKKFARMCRFARLIRSVDVLHPVEWSDLALAAGYFAQAHFGKEFKDFTGRTPTEYLALRHRIPAEREARSRAPHNRR